MSENQETQASLDNLFSKSDEATTTAETRTSIEYTPLDRIDNFPNHPYLVNDDGEMTQLAGGIKEQGVASPAIVRLKEDGRYEPVSGHRRKRANEIAELEAMPVIVGEFTEEQAAVLMVDSNCQARKLMPTESKWKHSASK